MRAVPYFLQDFTDRHEGLAPQRPARGPIDRSKARTELTGQPYSALTSPVALRGTGKSALSLRADIFNFLQS